MRVIQRASSVLVAYRLGRALASIRRYRPRWFLARSHPQLKPLLLAALSLALLASQQVVRLAKLRLGN